MNRSQDEDYGDWLYERQRDRDLDERAEALEREAAEESTMYAVTETTRHGGTWYWSGAGWTNRPAYYFSTLEAAAAFQAERASLPSDKPRLYAVQVAA